MQRIMMIKTQDELLNYATKTELVQFLHTHLDKFRDDPESIAKAIDYAFSTAAGKGGFILLAFEGKTLAGALVMNYTGMSKFIPGNILVYIAVHSDLRGRGIGSEIMKQAIAESKGSIALHVEYDNPAIHLYERLGFASKYAEMRLEKDD